MASLASRWRDLLTRWPEFDVPLRRPVALDERDYRKLLVVQEDVNASYPYVRDRERFGQMDVWEPADRLRGGDCEDLALRKWLQLLEWGWSGESLSLCICNAPQGLHAILLIETDRGYVGLDNLAWTPANLSDLGYGWLYRTDPGPNGLIPLWRDDEAELVKRSDGRLVEWNLAWHHDRAERLSRVEG